MLNPVILNGNNKRQKLNVVILWCSVLVQIVEPLIFVLKQNKRKQKQKEFCFMIFNDDVNPKYLLTMLDMDLSVIVLKWCMFY